MFQKNVCLNLPREAVSDDMFMQPWLNDTTTNAAYPCQEAFFSSKSMFHHLTRPNPRAGILVNLLMWIQKNKDILPIECVISFNQMVF